MPVSPEKVCHVVAGPNGSGKSTFALRYLPAYAGLADSLLVFDAASVDQRLVFRRNGDETVLAPELRETLKGELGV